MRGLLGKGLIICFVILTTCVVAQGQTGVSEISQVGFYIPTDLYFTGAGARAAGMGYAYLGVSDDVSAVSWNPAGLYRNDNPYEMPIVSVGVNKFSPSNDFTLSGLSATPQLYEDDEVLNGLGVFSIIAPLRVKGHPFVFGLSYSRADDEYFSSGSQFDTAIYYTLADQEAGNARPYQESSRGEGYTNIDILSVGFGTRLNNHMTAGATVNVYFGSGSTTTRSAVLMDGVAAGTSGQQVLQVDAVSYIDSASYSGMFLTLGTMYTRDKFSAGLVVKTPHTLQMEVDRTQSNERTINGQLRDDGTNVYYYDNNVIEIDIPLSIGLGLAYKAKENLTLAADLEYRNFESSEIRRRDSLKIVPGDQDQEFFTSYDPKYTNVMTFRVGGEYLLETGKTLIPVIPLRVGYAYKPIPTQEVGENLTLSSVSGSLFTIGSGIHWPLVHLDLAMVFASTSSTNYLYTADGRTLSYDQDYSANTLLMTFTGYF